MCVYSNIITGRKRRFTVNERKMLAILIKCIHYDIILLVIFFCLRTNIVFKSIFKYFLRKSKRVVKLVFRLFKFFLSIESFLRSRYFVAFFLLQSIVAAYTLIDMSRLFCFRTSLTNLLRTKVMLSIIISISTILK